LDEPSALTRRAHDAERERAPDGMDVYPLLRTTGGSMARFELAAGRTSAAMSHRTVDEIWYVVSGRGDLWRAGVGLTVLEPDTCVTIPRSTGFQVRGTSAEALVVVAVTMPPWPGDLEAEPVDGPWAMNV
jgi:mannose-6-phosphate isomerase-like protein (cupin superfamily)